MISNFTGQYAFLSNFSPSPVRIKSGDETVEYPTVEHAFQASKTLNISLRRDWEQVKVQVMLDLLRQKFAPGSELAQRLLDTGNEVLIEGNYWHNNFWGECTCSECSPGSGKNLLGRLLMKVREELRD